MRKIELVQLIKDQSGSQFGDRTIAFHIGQVFTTLCGQLFQQNSNQWEFFSKRVTLPVVNRVSVLTTPTIQTKVSGNGVPRITPVNDDSTIFYPSPSYAIGSSVDANKISGFVFYVVTGNEIRFNKSLPDSVTEVTATIIPEFQSYADDDLINLPAGIAQMIIDASVSAIKGDPSARNIYKQPK